MEFNSGNKFKYVRSYKDRDGVPRLYFHHARMRNYALRGPIGSAEFLSDYNEVLSMLADAEKSAFADLPLSDPMMPFVRLWRKAKERSTERGHEFDLTPEAIKALAEGQEYRCAISGLEMKIPRPKTNKGRDPYYMSIDRIDCARGYTKDNVRLVCLIVNIARSDWGEAPLMRVATAIRQKSKLDARPRNAKKGPPGFLRAGLLMISQ